MSAKCHKRTCGTGNRYARRRYVPELKSPIKIPAVRTIVDNSHCDVLLVVGGLIGDEHPLKLRCVANFEQRLEAAGIG